MKANSKRKVFGDAVDLLMGDMEEVTMPRGVQMLPVKSIQPFHDHPFHLYEGERLEDMIASVKEHGVLNPVIVQKLDTGYEMLSGHNRWNAAKLAGLKEIPAIVKTDLSEEEAYVYVIETNLMQRSFSDLAISEKAAVLKARYEKGSCQGKRNDILNEIARLEGKSSDVTSGHCDQKLTTRDAIGKEYELSGSSVGRLLKLNDLIKPFKDMVDRGALYTKVALQLAFLPENEQTMVYEIMKEKKTKITIEMVMKLRSHSGALTEAKVLVREYGNELKYTSATDFLRFDGECWREDKQMAIGAVEEFLDLQLQDAMDEVARVEKALEDAGVPKESIQAGPKELLKEVDGKLIPLVYMLMGAQTYLKFVQKRRDYKYIVSAANTAKPMIAISVSDLDKNENLINTPYATYDLRKGLAGELPHNPEDLITKITACSPGEDGKQIWLDALNLFFCKDQKLIDYVQETVGMAAIGKVYQEHMIIAYGGGANGKSTFWNTIFRVLGNYAGKLSAEALTMNCKRNVKPEMAELKGKRLIISSEMEEGMRLNTAVVKQLCSTDEIQAEKKYKDPFSFVPSHTLVLYTNHLPKVGANDDGIWRRLVVIPFNAKITGKSDIKNYADYLFEHAGPAIMSWIIEGAKRAIDKNFHTTLPDVVEAAIQAYREDNDWLGQFLEECCEIDPSYKEKSGELYQAYRAHCMQNGEYIRSTTDFYSSMDKAGYNRIRKNTGVQVVGLKLKEGQDFLE